MLGSYVDLEVLQAMPTVWSTYSEKFGDADSRGSEL